MTGLFSAKWLAMVALLASVAGGGGVRAEVLRVGGTGAGVITLGALAGAVAAETGIVIEVLPSLGSAGGLRALPAGRIDLAVIGRAITPEEAGTGVKVVAALRTPFVFVTSRAEAPAMRAAEIVDAYRNPKAQWRDGGAVTLVLRQRSESDTFLLARMLPGMAEAVEQARKRPEILISGFDNDNSQLAERTKDSLATMSFSQFMIERRSLRAIAIDGVAPSLATLEDGRYPHGRPFHLVVPAAASAAALRFVAFLQSERGRQVARGAHCLVGPAP